MPLRQQGPKCSNVCYWAPLPPLDRYWVCNFTLSETPLAARRSQRASPGKGTGHASGFHPLVQRMRSPLRSQLYVHRECLVENLSLIKQEMCHPTRLCPLPHSLIKGSHCRKEMETSLRGRGRQDSCRGLGGGVLSAPSSKVGAPEQRGGL